MLAHLTKETRDLYDGVAFLAGAFGKALAKEVSRYRLEICYGF
jgi:hypothetical protein